MSAIETLRDALFGNPPSPTHEPSREGVLAAFSALQGQVSSVEQALATTGIAEDIYATTAAGIAATTNGQLFLVKGDGVNSFADLYLNSAGSAASQGISIPSLTKLIAVEDSVAGLADVATSGDYSDLSGKPVFGTMAFQPANAYALKAERITEEERAKLASIAADATANATNAQLRDRATHTGEQEISTITGLIDALASKASGSGLADEEERATQREGEIDARIDAIAPLLYQSQGAPGDALGKYTTSLTGEGVGGPAPSGSIVVGDRTKVLRVAGAHTVATRERVLALPDRAFRVNYAAQRTTDPTDPAGDTVQFGIQWLTKNKAQISQRIVESKILTTGDGRYSVSIDIAAIASGDIIAWPSTTRYFVPFIHTFGADGVTDIELIEWSDITDATSASNALTAAMDTEEAARIADDTTERNRALAAEALLDNSIAGAVTGLSEVINELAEFTDGVDAVAQGARLTAGAQTLEYARGVMFGSATPILGPVGGINYVGFSTLGGYPTQLTFVTPRIFFDEATRARLVGHTVVFMSASELSPGFFPARKLSTTGVTVDIVGGGQRTNQGTVLADRQVGNMLYRMATYVMQGDEFFVGLPHQLANDSGTTGDHSLEIVSTTYAIDAVPAELSTTPADEQFAAKLAAYNAAEGIDALPEEIAEKTFGFANDLSEFTPLPAFFNGAVARVGDDGRNWGWTVPALETGTTTLMQVSIPMRGMGYLLAGRTVRVSFAMDTSDDYSEFQAAGATFAVARPSNANLFLGTTITQAPTVDVSNPNRRFYDFEATMDGTETVLKPFFRRGTQPAAAAEQYILVTDVTMEIVASPSDSLTLLEENLRLGEALRREAASEAVGGQISAAILGTGGEVITVGPSGAHFTTLSDAIDAVTDSSISKQYKICWKAGTILGALSRVAPAWTSIIAADRNEDAVISYTLPTDATALAIRDAELLNVYRHMSIIEGGTWELGNGRYPFHPESSGGQPDTEQRFINVVARHLGNLTAVNNTWNIASQFALGCGQSGGQILKIIDCDLSGPGGGFSTHGPNNGQPWLTPWVAEIENSKMVATSPGSLENPTHAVRVVSLAVGPGRVSLRNSEFDKLELTDTGWVNGPPAGDVMTAQVSIIAASCSSFEFVNSITLGDPSGAGYLPLIIPGAGA